MTIRNGGVANFNWLSLASGGTGAAHRHRVGHGNRKWLGLELLQHDQWPVLWHIGSATVNVTNGGQMTALGGKISLASGAATSKSTLNIDGLNSLVSTIKANGTGGTGNKIGTAGTATVNITGGGVMKASGGRQLASVRAPRPAAPSMSMAPAPSSSFTKPPSPPRLSGWAGPAGGSAALNISGGGVVSMEPERPGHRMA